LPIYSSVANSFRNLVVATPYEKITVSMICKAANVSRTAFYSCFSDKDDLVARLLEDDIVEPVRTMRRMLPTRKIKSAPQLVTEQIYLGFTKNRDYYIRINAVDGHRFIIQTLADKLSQLNTEILREYNITDQEKYYMGYFYAASNAVLISRWIDNGMDVEPTVLCSYYNKWTSHYWQQINPEKIDWSH